MRGTHRYLVRLACGAVALLGLGSDCPAQDLFRGDLMEHRINITAGFIGTDVFVYGVKAAPGDVVVVMRGPNLDVAVRRKERIAGIWLNTDRVDFRGIPSFFAIASSRPIDQVMSPSAQAREEIGLGQLKLLPVEDTDRTDVAEFAAALIRIQ